MGVAQVFTVLLFSVNVLANWHCSQPISPPPPYPSLLFPTRKTTRCIWKVWVKTMGVAQVFTVLLFSVNLLAKWHRSQPPLSFSTLPHKKTTRCIWKVWVKTMGVAQVFTVLLFSVNVLAKWHRSQHPLSFSTPPHKKTTRCIWRPWGCPSVHCFAVLCKRAS